MSSRYSACLLTFLAAASLALAFCPLARAADYYVCDCAADADADCQAGDDGADGTSEAAAWQTYSKARSEFGSLAPGDAILFCDGGAFSVEGGSRWVNTSCLADNPCVVSDYAPAWGSGDEALPLIRQAGSGHGFAFEDGGDAEHEEGYHVSNLHMVCTSCESDGGNAFFLYNDIDDVVIENVTMDGFTIGVHLAGSNACSSDPQCDGQNSRLTVRGCTIVNSTAQGFLGAGDGTVIENNYFENNGSREIFDHNIYYSGVQHGGTTGSRIAGNELYRSCLNADGECSAVSLVVHGNHTGLVIEDNLVREDVGLAGGGCWGIAVDGGYDEAESFTDTVIRGNMVVNVGNMAIGVSSCVNCLIENNVVISEQTDFGTTGIAVPDRDRGAGDAEMTNVDVRNNSIYMSGAGGTGIRVTSEGTGHMIVSNAIHYSGTASSWRCLDAGLAPADYEAVDNNVCFFPSAGSGAEWEDGSGTSPDPLAAWQAASGLGASSVMEDPGFSSPDGPDFNLRASSESAAMVDAGHPTLSAPLDFDGNARDSAPDSGAFEHGAGPPPDETGEVVDMVEPLPDALPDATTDPSTDPSTDTAVDAPGDPLDDAEAEDGEKEGCGCRVAGGDLPAGPAAAGFLFLIAGLLLAARRRRSKGGA
jgi:MYXO-CTERM domain-containing protein